MSSIAGRQLRTLLIGGLFLCFVTGGLIIVLAHRALISQFDDSLIAQVKFLSTLVDYSEEEILEFEESATDATSFGDVDSPSYFQVWRVQSRSPQQAESLEELERSESLEESESGLNVVMPDQENTPIIRSLTTPDGRPAHSVTLLTTVTRADDDLDEQTRQRLLARKTLVVIQIVAGTESIYPLLLKISIGVGFASIVMLLGFSGLAMLTVRRGLKPIRDANHRVGAIDANRLMTRLNASRAPTEIRPLLDSINGLLDKLEDSFCRERVSRALLAHELRNPIAELLMTAEVAARWPDDSDLTRQSLDKILGSALDLQKLITSMLRIARVQAGQEDPLWQDVQVSEIVSETIHRCAGIASTRNLVIAESIEQTDPVRSDPDLLRFVMMNLVNNAVEYTPRGGEVEVRVSNGDGSVKFTCTNSIADPAAIDCQQLTNAFQSGSPASPNNCHAGIGLAATDTICTAIGATMRLSIEDQRFVARAEFPADARCA